MEMLVKKHGFTLLRSVPLQELSATLYEMYHDRTGLKLVWLRRAEENKTFCIAFETLPENDTGVFHILEHSVLCGSDRYPVKEPFVELLKSSMNTFLNAMTFPDKTFYPVSSRNNADFLNLMRVYLDAVFHPQILTNPNIFRQEGWHYHFDKDGAPTFQGVVLNEMKGAFADADQLAVNGLSRALFPDTPYRFISGGDPACIPDLSYEAFLDTYQRCYSPSNAFVFLDGEMDMDMVLAILNGEYLAQLPVGQRMAPPPLQRPVQAEPRTITCEIAPEEEETNRWRVVWGHVIGTFQDRQRLIATQVLAETLCGTNQSPLSKAILEAGLAEDVSLSVQDGIVQPWLKLELKNLAEAQQAQAEQLLFDTLRTLAQGMNHDQLLSSLANMEFRMRERDYGGYPQGLVFGMNVLESWVYGGLPEANLTIGTVFETLRAKLDEGFFEQLIQELLLENPHSAKVVLQPSHTAGRERSEQEAARLKRELSAWSEEEREAMQRQQAEFIQWQQKPDTLEALAAIPQLTLDDIETEPEDIPTHILALGNARVLHHSVPASGIVYVNLYFNADGLSPENLSCLSLLCDLPGSLRTARHSAEEIVNAQRLHLGYLSFHGEIFEEDAHPGIFTTQLCVSFNTLASHVEQAVQLVSEVLTETELGNAPAVLDILRQKKAMLSQQIIMGGAGAALQRLHAQTSAAGVATDCLNGFACYEWLRQQESDYDFDRLHSQLQALQRLILCQAGATVSITGEMTDTARQALQKLISALPAAGEKVRQFALEPLGIRREGIIIPADIAFAVRGGMLPGGIRNHGVLSLLSKVVSLGYLWNTVRVQGGAYGSGLVMESTGLAACYSYRDPHGAWSLQSYLGCGDYVRSLCAGGEDLTGYIIGAVSDASPLLTPRMKGRLADDLYWRKVSHADRCVRRRELIGATGEQLTALADQLDSAMENGGICVIGSQNQIDACGEMTHLTSL